MKLWESEPSWGLWCPLKIWWESSVCPFRSPPLAKVHAANVLYMHWFKLVHFHLCLPSSASFLYKDGQIVEPKMSASFVPDHKASMVLFLDRVYGIDNQDFLLHVLEVGFLPDMRASASLDTVSSWHCQKHLHHFFTFHNIQYGSYV